LPIPKKMDYRRLVSRESSADGIQLSSTLSFPLVVAATLATLGCRPAEPFSSRSSDRSGLDDAGNGVDYGPGDIGGGAGGSLGGPGGTGGDQGSGGAVAIGSGGESGSGGIIVIIFGSGGGGGISADVRPDVVDAVVDADASSPDTTPEAGPNDCQHQNWRATASAAASAGPVANGIDGDLTTRWGNGRFQDGTDWYQVDFGGPIRISDIVLDNSMTYPGDFPGAYAVYGSLDGVTFTGPFVTGNGTNDLTTAQFAAQTVRAIRINQTGTTRSKNWWQIGELKINCVP
jgi:hypothetical protein